MKKRIAFICLAFTLFLLLAGVLTLTFGAQGEPPHLSLDYANLIFSDSITIQYAVAANGMENVSLLCWTSPEDAYEKGTEDRVITTHTSATIEGKPYLVFDYTDLAAKQMTDEIYVRAYAVVDGEALYSNVRKYSVLEYAYTVLGKMNNTVFPDKELCDLMEAMLSYGGAAQVYFNYETDRLASTPHHLVQVSGGTLTDGTTFGLYPTGAVISITAPAVNGDGATFSRWADKNGNKISSDANTSITVGATNATYSPVYVKYSAGLEFESNGDGTCILLGMGDCTDTELIIPPTSPDGDKVVEIDGSAFAGEPITSVTFPATIESIGRRAFNGCASLTAVSFDGTATEWENVYINTTGNDVILNADVKFLGETRYTVTFVDWDDTVLKTETVVSGKSATAPEAPSRQEYTFTGWDKEFSNVTENITVTAVYKLNLSSACVVVNSVTVDANSETFDVVISILNNPGIASLKFDVVFDESLTLQSVAFDAAYGAYVTAPEPFKNPQTISLMSPTANNTASGTFATLTFSISETVEAGDSIDISLVLDRENIFDANFDAVIFEAFNGQVTLQ